VLNCGGSGVSEGSALAELLAAGPGARRPRRGRFGDDVGSGTRVGAAAGAAVAGTGAAVMAGAGALVAVEVAAEGVGGGGSGAGLV
jgi:hypothetical protein